MRILLDTHCWLWAGADRSRLSRMALGMINDPRHELLLSAASAWEIAIKYALGRLPLPLPPHEYVPDRMQIGGVDPLPVQHAHALHVSALPMHHKDPFDRLLIAQAQIEGIAIMTADRRFEPYDITIHWAN